MKQIEKNQWKAIISGANLLGTGGGGTITGASAILQKVKRPITLATFQDLRATDLVCTVFGVGGKQNCDPVIASKKALALFQKIFNRKIAAIISVEAGPMAIANAMFIASELKIPLLDSDIVGLRSSPEVFLETISIAGLNRTPCAIADDKGNSALLYESQRLEQMEQFFRNFALSVGGDAVVAGYPLQVKDLKNIVPVGSITIAQETGNALTQLRNGKISLNEFCSNTGWKLVDIGIIKKQKKTNEKGFSEGEYLIANKKNNLQVFFKNENLIVLGNNKVLVTCPDSISLLDLETKEAINNFESIEGKEVAILGKKAFALWRSKKGKKLFSPKNLGFTYQQKLLR
jgi:DUF917 family protein